MAERKRLTPRQLRKLFAMGILSASGKGEKRKVGYQKPESKERKSAVERAVTRARTGGGSSLRPVERFDGVQARVTGDPFAPGKVTRVRVFSPEARAGIRAGGEEARGAREYQRTLRRAVYDEAKRQSFDGGREFNRSQASKGGKKAAATKSKIREAQAGLTDKPSNELLGILSNPTSRIAGMAAKAELKKRGIVIPTKGPRRKATRPAKPIKEKKPKAPRKEAVKRAAAAAKG